MSLLSRIITYFKLSDQKLYLWIRLGFLNDNGRFLRAKTNSALCQTSMMVLAKKVNSF